MTTTSIFLFLSLVLFVIVDSFSGIKAALITSLIFATASVLYSLHAIGEIDWVTGLEFSLILLFGGISYWKKTSIQFKLQPVILSVIVTIACFITYNMGQPFILELMDKYQAIFPEETQRKLQDISVRMFIAEWNYYLGYSLLIHAAITAWAAFKLNNWWWIFMRGVGLLVLAGCALLVTRLSLISGA